MRRLSMFWIAWSAFSIGAATARAADNDWLTTVSSPNAPTTSAPSPAARRSATRSSIVNRTDSDIRIADWRTKCGCTDVKVGARVIPPGTQTTVEATINTTNFQGYKPSGLTLILDRPVFVEVDLNLTCFIRGDILMNPGQVDFGTLRRSPKLPSASLDPDLCRRPVRLGHRADEDPDRSGQGGGPGGQPDRRRPDPLADHRHAPAGLANGYLKDEITLVTNDTPAQTIPISVVANIQTARLGHAIDHQPRSDPARPDHHPRQYRARPLAPRRSA